MMTADPVMAAAKMHADELEIDAPLVRRLLKAQIPHWADLHLYPVPSAGTDNALYRLGRDKVARLPRIAWAAGLIEKEYAWLPRLAPQLPLAIPEPIAMGEPGEGYPWRWGIYKWLEGEEAAPQNLESLEQAAVDLAHFVASLQQRGAPDGPPAGPGNSYRGVPLKERDKPTREAIAALARLLDTAPALAAWEKALSEAEYTGPPQWLHGDLRPGNLLAREGKLSAVIDFGCLGVGDPACDLQVAWSFFPAGAREAFRKELAVDDATWERGRGWALSVSLIALPYYWDRNRQLADIARRTIREVLA